MNSVAGLLRSYSDFLKNTPLDESESDGSDESESDEATPMTADEIAAQALTIAKAHDVSATELVKAIIAQVAPESAAIISSIAA